jgi:hypothetical protein
LVFGVRYALVVCAHVRFDSDSCANPTSVKSKPLHAPCTHQSTTAHLSPKDRTSKPVGDDWADCGCSNSSSSSSSRSSSGSSNRSVITSIVPNPTGHITPATNSPRQPKLPLQGKKRANQRTNPRPHESRVTCQRSWKRFCVCGTTRRELPHHDTRVTCYTQSHVTTTATAPHAAFKRYTLTPAPQPKPPLAQRSLHA